MSERQSHDAVIVGGGVIGLACAWRLAERGAQVAVAEREEPPAGATDVAAGMLAPVGELTFGEPELRELTLEGAVLYPEFVAELEATAGTETGYRRDGALHVALDRDEAARLRRVHGLQRELGLEAEWLPARGCRELEPGLPPSFSGGVFAAGEASVDPRALTRALRAACEAAGVKVRTGAEVVDGVWEGERLAGVRTAVGEELRGRTVVLATGAWSGQSEWLPEEGRPQVRPVRGEVVELATRGGGEVPCERIVVTERVYLVPRPDGRLIAGATVEERGFDATVSAGGVYELLREAYRVLPEIAEMELLDARAGLRPGTPDNLPLVGPSPVEGLHWATGHYRNGILLAPLAASQVAEQLQGVRA